PRQGRRAGGRRPARGAHPALAARAGCPRGGAQFASSAGDPERRRRAPLRASGEQPLRGSAGGPKRALPLIERDPFLIVNGDTLTDVDLRALWQEHVNSGGTVTMALGPNPAPDKDGGGGGGRG